MQKPVKLYVWFRDKVEEAQKERYRNDDQSLSPVTPLVCLLFLSFLIP